VGVGGPWPSSSSCYWRTRRASSSWTARVRRPWRAARRRTDPGNKWRCNGARGIVAAAAQLLNPRCCRCLSAPEDPPGPLSDSARQTQRQNPFPGSSGRPSSNDPSTDSGHGNSPAPLWANPIQLDPLVYIAH
jgi:hypothetical protein